ncbi:MAG: hypothetical protein Q8Q49_02460 [bacterium]|nr:hypothetical protein [bacterium]
MNTKKLATAIATSALLINAMAPAFAFAETTIQVTGNGSYSDNDAKVEQKSTTEVVQTNTANVTNNVSGNASTGGNDANDNTGGDVAIVTGDAKSVADVSNTLNSNSADVVNCNCEDDTKVVISGNGSESDNYVKVKNSNNTGVYQDNDAKVSNSVETKASTGYNDANRNTGGDTTIITGDAKAKASVSTVANANEASIGGGNGHDGGSLRAIISGNGSYSDNDIRIYNNNDTTLVQGNDADIYNWVEAKAKTGSNDANDNTGGDVAISTGDALAIADVDNMVNFNAADLDCGCLTDVKVKIDGNGYESDNDVKVKLNDEKGLFQDNVDYTRNEVDAKAKTGYNEIERSTGDVEHPSDPVIVTGDATTHQNVSNTGNANVIGSGLGFHIPELNVDVDFDLSLFWAWLNASSHTSN